MIVVRTVRGSDFSLTTFLHFHPLLGTEIIAETIPENNTWTPSWFLEIESNDESPIVTVHSPPDALIGRYKVAIYIESVIDGITHHALDNEPGILEN